MKSSAQQTETTIHSEFPQ